MTVFVMTHKPLSMKFPTGYKPMMVGASNKIVPNTYFRDDVGKNISKLNPSFCELTGLYEIWQNISEEHIGLVHYRRYFLNKNYHSRFFLYIGLFLKNKVKLRPIPEEQLKGYLNNYDWIVSTREIEMGKNLLNHWNKYHQESDLITVRSIIEEISPAYLSAFDHILKHNNRMSPFNMFYTTKAQLNEYASWLFPILFEAEKRIDISEYDDYQKRLFGFVGEELLNVWLYYHQELAVKYLTVYNTHLTTRSQILSRIKDRGRIK